MKIILFIYDLLKLHNFYNIYYNIDNIIYNYIRTFIVL
jgi:hypothetical protein